MTANNHIYQVPFAFLPILQNLNNLALHTKALSKQTNKLYQSTIAMKKDDK